ncbi:MAG: helix-turn-helix transcriptional regulator [Fusobacteriaceae bacterium]|nr:helix-turn-helix transcriptional regulator [Fusobacteriaceae bacterium]
MINIYTKGKKYSKDFSIPLIYSENIINNNKGFKIAFLEENSNILEETETFKITSTAILIVNISNSITDIKGTYKVLNFHPTIVNNMFSYENIKNKELLKGSDRLDTYYLNIFSELKNFNIMEINPYYEEKIRKLFNAIQFQLEEQPDEFWPCRSRTLFLELLIILTNMENEVSHKNEDNLVENIKSYLNNHFEEQITLNILTKEFSINKTTLSKKFKEETGKTILEFLIEIRLRLAKTLLRNTSLPIVEILYKVGFNNSTNFNKAFKKRFGSTPINYRKLKKLQ